MNAPAVVVVAALFVASTAPSSSASGAAVPPDTIRALNHAARDSALAIQALPRIRAWAAKAVTREERQRVLWALQLALIKTRGPTREFVEVTDSLATLAADSTSRAILFDRAGAELVARGDQPEVARRYVEAAMTGAETIPDLRDVILGSTLKLRSKLQWAAGARDSALATMERAVAENREDQFPVMRELRLELAELYERAGRAEDGLATRVKVAGTWGSSDTTSLAELRSRWTARHGTQAGLDAAVAKERERSHRALVFEAPKVDRTLPEITLPALVGDSIALASLRGKVAVIDFWGTWCGPCVEAMPKIQKVHERFGPRGVQVLGFGVEFQPGDLAEARKLVGEFMKEHGLTFPTLIDLQGRIAEGLGFPAFPTTWVVDRSGRVRYQNAGSSEVSGLILEEQLESLLK